MRFPQDAGCIGRIGSERNRVVGVTRGGEPGVFLISISSSLVAVTKSPTRSSLREEGLFGFTVARDIVHHGRVRHGVGGGGCRSQSRVRTGRRART